MFYFELLDKMLLSMLSFPAKSLRMTKALMFLNNIFKSLGHGNRPHRLLHERERERERARKERAFMPKPTRQMMRSRMSRTLDTYCVVYCRMFNLIA